MANSSANATRDTFLNYFFGSQGPTSGPSLSIPPQSRLNQVHAAPDTPADELPDQDMGRVAAFDMKSLGPHLETVRKERRSLYHS
jgi:hypothetical protein